MKSPILRDDLKVAATTHQVALTCTITGVEATLSPTAAEIARRLDGQRTLDAIATEVGLLFDRTIRPTDVVKVADALRKLGMLKGTQPHVEDARAQKLQAQETQITSQRRSKLGPLQPGAPRRDLHYQCRSTARCCSGRFHVSLTGDDLALLDDPEVIQLSRYRDNLIVPRKQGHRELLFLNHIDGHCGFLEEDGKCAIHRVHGLDHKPRACRAFPFVPIWTPTGTRLRYRPECSGQHLMADAPLASENARETWEKLMIQREFLHAVPEEIQLTPDQRQPWAEFDAHAASLEEHARNHGWRSGLVALRRASGAHPIGPKLSDFSRALKEALAESFARRPDGDMPIYWLYTSAGRPGESLGFMLEIAQACESNHPAKARGAALTRAGFGDHLFTQYLMDLLYGCFLLEAPNIQDGAKLASLVLLLSWWTQLVLGPEEGSLEILNEALVFWHLAIFKQPQVRAFSILSLSPNT